MIIRTPKKARFTVIGNALIEDPHLSWAAMGMLVYLLSKPDNWRILPAQLIKERQLGRDGVYRLLKELERAGYVQKHQVKNSAGRMAGTDWCVFDEPQPVAPRPEIPHPGEPHPELPHPVNPLLLNTEISTKTDVTKHTYTDRTVQESSKQVESAQPCVCIGVSLSGESQAEEKAEVSESAVASCGQPEESGEPQPVKVVEPSLPRVAGEPSASLATAVLPTVLVTVSGAATPLITAAAVPTAAPGRRLELAPEKPVSQDTPPAPPPDSPPRHETVGATATMSPPHAQAPAQEAPPAVAPAPSRPNPFRYGPAVRTPLDADEQEAFVWAAGHSFWHSRITTPENLRRNFQEGKAFRLQFFDARNAKALASDATTGQGLGDLVENHTRYRSYYDAESDRYFQPSPTVGTPGPFHGGGGVRATISERPRKPSAVERADHAEQRYYERLARERAAAARTIAGCRLDPSGYVAALAAPDPNLRASLDVTIW